MKTNRSKSPKPERRDPDFASEIITDILRAIRLQFCPDMPDKAWFKDHYHLLRKNAVLWPARFMASKGFSMSGERYKEVMFGILTDIKRHGDLSRVTHWQFYLMTCVQRHFKMQWETYYNESKAIQARIDHALLACRGANRPAPGVDPMAAMVAAHRVASPGRKVRTKATAKQLGLWR